MLKNLAKRSKIKTLQLNANDIKRVAVAGDEVYIQAVTVTATTPFQSAVYVKRQSEKELEKVLPFQPEAGRYLPFIPVEPTSGIPRILSARVGPYGILPSFLDSKDYVENGVNLMVGFSDVVEFSAPGEVGQMCTIIIEEIHYEKA